MVDTGLDIEEREKTAAQERQESTRAQPGEQIGTVSGGAKLAPPMDYGKTRDKVGAAVGMSWLTYEKAKAVALGASIEEREREAARERQGTRTDLPSGKLPEGEQGDSRDKVGAAVGMSGKTYEQAKAVVAAAEAKREWNRLVPELMRLGLLAQVGRPGAGLWLGRERSEKCTFCK